MRGPRKGDLFTIGNELPSLLLSVGRGPDVWSWDAPEFIAEAIAEAERSGIDHYDVMENAIADEDQLFEKFLRRLRTRRVTYLRRGTFGGGLLVERNGGIELWQTVHLDTWRGRLTITPGSTGLPYETITGETT